MMTFLLFLLEWVLRPIHLGAALRLQTIAQQRFLHAPRASRQSESSHVLIHMCAFNGIGVIESALESVRSQSHQNWTLLISDDCSEDETFDVVSKLAAQDERIKCLQNPTNFFQASIAHRNVGLQEFYDGEYDFFTILDQDDVAEPDWLEKCLGLDWNRIGLVRMWNERWNWSMTKPSFRYPAAAQLFIPRDFLLPRVSYRRLDGAAEDTEFLRRMEYRAIKRRKPIVVTPFLCQRMRFHAASQSNHTEGMSRTRTEHFLNNFWSA